MDAVGNVGPAATHSFRVSDETPTALLAEAPKPYLVKLQGQTEACRGLVFLAAVMIRQPVIVVHPGVSRKHADGRVEIAAGIVLIAEAGVREGSATQRVWEHYVYAVRAGASGSRNAGVAWVIVAWPSGGKCLVK